ncbi:MAG: MtnX-like HAD-IB family phosphatase [Proteobacteria bacterium]|nr:MtnX-like HAD-IB family phosphatase [Pseudomonadota bacterium]
MKTLVISDFDGTISTRDVGYEIIERFTGEGWKEIDRAYCAGEIGSRDAYIQITSLFRGTKEEMVRYVLNRASMDPHFNEFYLFCKEKEIDIKIVSDGLDFYIDVILKKYGLGDIEFFSNVVGFHNGRASSIEFPHHNGRCKKCGTCKSTLLEQYRQTYDRIIYVGDGYSDVCPAKDADVVFAKGILYEKCLENGRSCIHYENFRDVEDHIRERLSATASPARVGYR